VAESGASEGITRSRRSAPGRAGTGARVVSLIDDLERVITTGQDGREYLARTGTWADNAWLRRQLESLDGGRA
jgi:hypothetical protein